MPDTHESIWSHLVDVPFRQDWINAGGIKTRIVEAGSPDRPTVVFLHGIAGSWEGFCANIGPFARQFRVFAFDWIGAGFTDKPEQPIYTMQDYVKHLHDVLAAVGVARTSLVGVSMGGWSAINFTHAHPEMVERLVICAASGLRRPPGFTPPAAASIRNDRAKAIDDPSWDNVSSVFTDLIHDPVKRIPDLIKLRQTIYSLPEMKASMARILAITATERFNESALSDDEWRSIDQPVLLIESTSDSEHFRRNTARAHSLLRNSAVFAMEGVAHWPQFEKPEVFNQKAISFLLGQ
ncbi:alpha/beta fold hydrolase [Bradyrhizobium sp. GCM10027634]|uniref:alpha/beta fold hydrolase n=1 Tax=unclassified Bradyrhizobium TaxID=2631580 RepID=UPI00188C6D4A|nr:MULTISPECIES: alpha/beta hydrolase [unclassified Bradyrhizobium]MDN5005605.1 alpha/beta hydrolase [Bradyrhizobium sp. WYCCWR 12677]QOZ44604.1 alpha/beta hydrolase [Bradyrhizobium sp. CCBAU 53340]